MAGGVRTRWMTYRISRSYASSLLPGQHRLVALTSLALTVKADGTRGALANTRDRAEHLRSASLRYMLRCLPMLTGPLAHDLSGTCPHCHHAAHFGQFHSTELQKDVEDEVLSFTEELRSARCPSCQGFVIDYIKWKTHPDYAFEQTLNKWSKIFPPPVRGLPNEIPKLLRELFEEGRRVATQSDRAAAVLARALLQLTLREVGF